MPTTAPARESLALHAVVEISGTQLILLAEAERALIAEQRRSCVVPDGCFCDECGEPFSGLDEAWTLEPESGLRHSCRETTDEGLS